MGQKRKCKATTKDGTPCQNWAQDGSMYCHLHQDQPSQRERRQHKKEREKADSAASVFIVIVAVVGAIISLAAGCEQEFAEWLAR